MHSIILSKGSKESVRLKLKEIISKDLDENDPDVTVVSVVQNKRNISITEVRAIIKDINMPPVRSDIKVILINKAHLLSIEAQNALLKVLEEPPSYVRFILEVNHHDNILPTIVSRSLVINLKDSSFNLVDHKFPKDLNILNFLDNNIGARIDILVAHKKIFIERENVALLMTHWLHELMCSLKDKLSDLEPSEIQHRVDIVNFLKEEKTLVEKTNTNAYLVLESFLVNI